MSHIPENLYYSKEHEWVKVDNTTATFGITDYAQQKLGDIVFVELAEEGAHVTQMGECCVVESVKAASDIYTPLSGTVKKANTILEEAPEKINLSPYEDGWIVQLSDIDPTECKHLMSAAEYRVFIGEA